MSKQIILLLLPLWILSFAAFSQDEPGKLSTIPSFTVKGNIGGSFSVGFLSANAGDYKKGEPGTVAHLTFTYAPWNFHAIGLGVGSQLPAATSNFLHMPVFVHYKSWISQKPMIKVGMNGGYGFAFTDESINITEAKGGLMANPFVGIKLNRSNDWAWTLNFGLLYQKLYYKYGDADIWGSETEIDLKMWRFMFTTSFEI